MAFQTAFMVIRMCSKEFAAIVRSIKRSPFRCIWIWNFF